MDFKEIKELVKMVDESNLAYFEVKNGESFLKMDKSLTRSSELNQFKEKSIENIDEGKYVEDNLKKLDKAKNEIENVKESENKITEDEDLIYIKSPMVGTFYGAPSPEKDSFVKEGVRVSKGHVLCIIEAMKLMNEIECEYDCEIVKILVKDGEMVEYGQSLFSVRSV